MCGWAGVQLCYAFLGWAAVPESSCATCAAPILCVARFGFPHRECVETNAVYVSPPCAYGGGTRVWVGPLDGSDEYFSGGYDTNGGSGMSMRRISSGGWRPALCPAQMSHSCRSKIPPASRGEWYSRISSGVKPSRKLLASWQQIADRFRTSIVAISL